MQSLSNALQQLQWNANSANRCRSPGKHVPRLPKLHGPVTSSKHLQKFRLIRPPAVH